MLAGKKEANEAATSRPMECADFEKPCRMNAKSAIQSRIETLTRKARRLQTILDMPPTELSPEQDEAVYQEIADSRCIT
jgi:hypothetical protein